MQLPEPGRRSAANIGSIFLNLLPDLRKKAHSDCAVCTGGEWLGGDHGNSSHPGGRFDVGDCCSSFGNTRSLVGRRGW